MGRPGDDTFGQQRRVDRVFQESAPFWKEAYARGGIVPRILQERLANTLGWVDTLALPPGARALEVGCGPGVMSVALARRGLRVLAVDRVASMIELTRDLSARSDATGSLAVAVGDVHDLPARDGAFDLVVALGVLPWVEHADRAIREMGRVTAAGGHVIFTAPNARGLTVLLDPLRNPWLTPLSDGLRSLLEWLRLRRRRPRIRMYTRRFLETAAAMAGLVTIRTRTHGFNFSCLYRPILPEPLATLAHLRMQRLADRPVPLIDRAGHMHYVMARKSR